MVVTAFSVAALGACRAARRGAPGKPGSDTAATTLGLTIIGNQPAHLVVFTLWRGLIDSNTRLARSRCR